MELDSKLIQMQSKGPVSLIHHKNRDDWECVWTIEGQTFSSSWREPIGAVTQCIQLAAASQPSPESATQLLSAFMY